MTTEMATIRDCSALDCTHNKSWRCLASVVSVGKKGTPTCDTYNRTNAGAANSEPCKGVGSCGVYRCLHNRELTCIAYTIKVRQVEGEARCKTYKNRYK